MQRLFHNVATLLIPNEIRSDPTRLHASYVIEINRV